MTRPHVIQCGHSFCMVCVHAIRPTASASNDTRPCPLCRALFKIDEIRLNDSLDNLVTMLIETNPGLFDKDDIDVYIRRKNVPVIRCSVCNGMYESQNPAPANRKCSRCVNIARPSRAIRPNPRSTIIASAISRWSQRNARPAAFPIRSIIDLDSDLASYRDFFNMIGSAQRTNETNE